MSLAKSIRRAALFAALEQLGKKLGCRDLLTDGASIPIAIELNARVRRATITEVFDGVLTVGHSFKKSSSSACDQDHLLACFADIVSPTKRAQHFELIREYFKVKKLLPPVDKAVLAECSSLLEELRFRRTSESRGAIRYELADADE